VPGDELIRRRIAGACVRCGDPHPLVGLDTLPNLLCARCEGELTPAPVTPADLRASAIAREHTIATWLKGSD
jgi:hypothetical protein